MRTLKRLMLPTTLMLAAFNAGCNDSHGISGGVCPSLKEYSIAEQKAAAQEIRNNPNGQLAKLVRDYGQLRKACRV